VCAFRRIISDVRELMNGENNNDDDDDDTNNYDTSEGHSLNLRIDDEKKSTFSIL